MGWKGLFSGVPIGVCLALTLSSLPSPFADFDDFAYSKSVHEIRATGSPIEHESKSQEDVEDVLWLKDSNELPSIMNASSTLSFRSLTYAFPIRNFRELARQEQPPVIVGVLSAATNTQRRSTIRDTWAYNRSNVFFLVAGPWKPLEAESEQYQDLFWIDDEEHYRGVTWKTVAFFNAVHKHVRHFRHIFKTDDDSYVNVGEIEKSSLAEYKGDFVGRCMEHMVALQVQLLEKEYPRYASGAGYQVSRKFVSCMAEHLATFHNVYDEDANTGLLARLCGVYCQTDGRIYPWQPARGVFNPSTILILQHYVTNPTMMQFYHERSCKGPLADVQSCGFHDMNYTAMNETQISCGLHYAKGCSLCPGIHQETWCNGMCQWCPFGTLNALKPTNVPREELEKVLEADKKYRNYGDHRCVLKDFKCRKNLPEGY